MEAQRGSGTAPRFGAQSQPKRLRKSNWKKKISAKTIRLLRITTCVLSRCHAHEFAAKACHVCAEITFVSSIYIMLRCGFEGSDIDTNVSRNLLY